MRTPFAVAAVAACVAGCISTPTLDLGGVAISEIVERVKCELAAAVPDVRGDYNPGKDFHWLKYWTAKVDLDLQTTNSSTVTPSSSYLDPAHSLTVGFGGQLKTEAYRSDKLSFTLSIDELSSSRFQESCAAPRRTGLLGKLGLDEWVSSALAPVQNRQLTIGYHAPPTAKPLPVPSPGRLSSRKTQAAGFVLSPFEEAKLGLANAEQYIKQARELTDAAEVSVMEARNLANKANAEARNDKMPREQRVGPTYVAANESHKLADMALVMIDSAKAVAWTAKTELQEPKRILKNVKRSAEDRQKVDAEKAQLLDKKTKLSAEREGLPPGDPKSEEIAKQMRDLDEQLRVLAVREDLINVAQRVDEHLKKDDGTLAQLASRAKEAADQADSAKSAATAAWELLPRDPPIDSILHSVKFTVTASANATPNWMLERFRGPGLSNPFASAQRQRIHELTIVLGAPAEPGGKALSDEQSRQLFNQRLDSLRLLVIPVN